MKAIFSTICMLLFLNSSVSSQNLVPQKPERNIPVAVSAAFSERFPGHDSVWFSNYQGRYDQKLVYEARFIFDKQYSSAIFDLRGTFLAFAANVEKSEIPQKALDHMKENFPAYPILDAILVSYAKSDARYELGIMVDGEYIIKVFSEDGDFIKSTRA